MKWIFIVLTCGALAFMAYSTYSSINFQLQSSAIHNSSKTSPTKTKPSVEKVEETLMNTKKIQPK